jgi:hypothetical protein
MEGVTMPTKRWSHLNPQTQEVSQVP